MSIKNGYEVFSFSRNIYNISSEALSFVCFSSIVIPVILFKFILANSNIHIINITSLICLILLWLILPLVGHNPSLNIINLGLIGVAIGLLFIGGIFILSMKFEGINFTTSMTIYSLTASIGYYCAYITSNTSEETLGPNGFLISICCVLISLLLYYLHLFKKLKLYK